MANVIDILIKAQDNASKVVNDFAAKTENGKININETVKNLTFIVFPSSKYP